MARLNRQYQYKGNTYVVTQVGLTAKIDGGWVSAVGYADMKTVDVPPTETKYIREAVDFDAQFIPTMLEIGDYVIGLSMARPRSRWQVTEIKTTEDETQYAIAENVVNKNEIIELTLEISENAAIELYDGEAEQAATYYYHTENIDEIVRNVPTIIEISSMLSDGAERVKNISKNSSSFKIEEARESVKQTLDNIYKRFDV